VSVAPAYLVLGDDPTLRADALRTLVADLLGEDDPSLALEEFALAAGRAEDAEDGGAGNAALGAVVAAALNAAATPPFGTQRRVIVVRDAGLLGAGETDAVARYLADPSPTSALVLVAGGGRLPAALSKAVKAAGGREIRPDSERTSDALAGALKRAGVSLTPSAARRVTEWLGDDAGRVAGLLDLLRSTFGEGTNLDVDDVEPYLGEAGAVAPYQLTGAIDRGEADEALVVLHRLRGAGFHPLQVMALLHRHHQRLLRLDDPHITGEAEAVSALGGKVKPYPAGLALRQARLLGPSGLRAAYDLLARADVNLRGATAVPEDAVLEVLVARLAGLARRARTGAASGGRARSRR
jgi:DNA polymerase-3 subunit delta